MKYKAGQRLNLKMCLDFCTNESVEVEIIKVDEATGLIWLKVPLKYGGYRKMFGYERDLEKMI